MKVLTIGNSLTENSIVFLEKMAEMDKNIELIIGTANIGGCSLEKHWNLVEQCDLLPDVKPYNFHLTHSETQLASLKDMLIAEKWDIITIQQFSNLSGIEESYYPYVFKLQELIRELAPQAKLMILQTWAYAYDAPYFAETGMNQDKMFQSIKKACENVAKKLDCNVIPCGEAFQRVRKIFNYEHDNTFNFKDPAPMKLPDQSKSLIAGYFWQIGNTNSGKAELHYDFKHANVKGQYLANAVFYEMLTHKNIFDNKFCPDGISIEELQILKQASHVAVSNT